MERGEERRCASALFALSLFIYLYEKWYCEWNTTAHWKAWITPINERKKVKTVVCLSGEIAGNEFAQQQDEDYHS